ncbi:MAG TPA: peptidoglycan-binding protein [Candidatus Paceibacterota bacterium]|nr:peptidoglycan-binding protein [Candidatus Paceibacterota bacterium]
MRPVRCFNWLWCIFVFTLVVPSTGFAATAIYRSVSPSNTSVLDSAGGSKSLTISGSTATFGGAIANNVGVGDVIQYDSASNGTINAVAFIYGRTDSTHYTVKNASGGTPTAVTGSTAWSIYRAYTSLGEGFVGSENTGINSSVRDFDTTYSGTDGKDLTVLDQQWNFAAYGNGTTRDHTPNPYLIGWTTGPTTYIRIYTPTSTAEVGTSQRANGGKWDPNKYGVSSPCQGLWLQVNYARIDGIQMDLLHTQASTSGAGEYQISNNLIDPVVADNFGCFFSYFDESASNGASVGLKFWNNIVANSGPAGGAVDLRYLGGQVTLYNNTFYNDAYPFFVGASNMLLKNNIFASTTEIFRFGGSASASSDYNSFSASSVSGYTNNTHDRFSQTFSLNDPANYDYNLTGSDTAARDRGVDLSGDSLIPFSIDQTGSTRPGNSIWDIGALEYFPAPDTTPPGRSAGAPSGRIATSTTSTNITLNTNESSTCKYSTTPNTAYGSMTNTFTTTGGTSHSTAVSVSSGHPYTYYIRCQDGASNANTDDYTIQFFVNQAGTVYADSCSVSDVNTAYSYTYAGDTLKLPAGTCTGWTSSSGLAIGKAITLQGAGIDQTILEIASTTGTYNSAAIPIFAPATVRDLTVRTETSGNSGTWFAASADGFHFTNVKYVDRTSTTGGYFLYASAYGLVDNSDITSAAGDMELILVRGPSNSWQTANSMGSSSAVFIENSIFRGPGYVTDCNSNARCVVRNISITGQMKVDGHGLASNTPARGVRQYELYNTTWSAADGAWTAIEMRGGTGMIFGNRSTGGNFLFNEYCATAVWANCGGVQLTAADYPISDQIGVGKDPKAAHSEPYYVWDTLKNAAQWPINLGYGEEALLSGLIVANRDYYISSTSVAFNGTANGTSAGVGTGLLAARPATCTTGVAYWATDQGGSWNTINGTGADGALYTCISTNTWRKSYVPYALPHYLAAASTTGTSLVDRGMGARFFGVGTFYGVATSSASGTYADMAINPSSTSADTWLDVSISLWNNTGTRHKTWTESSENATTTLHTIGDLAANTGYNVKVDNVLGSGITGGSCSGGVCTSNGSGKITFTYSGGYSTHTFDVEDVSASSASAPSVTTSAASSIAATTAILNGSITNNGGADATQSGFAYGTVSTLQSGVIATSTLGSQTGNASFNSSISSLTCNTTYYFRAYATNTGGTGYGSILSFTSGACTPTVTTQAASSITNSSATANGTITATGGANATSRGAVYGVTTAYGATTTEAGSFSTGAFTASLSGLACNTLYHVKAYAINSGGAAYGSDVTFTSSACASPSVTTSAASSIGQTSATLNALITATGGQNATQSGFAYGTSSALSTVIATSTLGSQTGAVAFSSSVSSLTCETTYYFRAYATNPTGTSYGSVVSFTAASCVTVSEPTPVSSASRPSSQTHRETAVAAPSSVVTVSSPVLLPTLRQFIDALISAGVIPADKAETARAALLNTAPASTPSVNLAYHDQGDAVKSLQTILASKGFLTATPNGVFGPATLAALKAFQKANGVPATGFYGPLTRAAMGQ